MMFLKRLLPIAFLLLIPTISEAQRLQPIRRVLGQQPTSNCPGGVCPAPTATITPPCEPIEAGQPVAENEWYKILVGPNRKPTAEEATAVKGFSKRAVRIINGNACGSGNLCGRDDAEGKIYILTNAHVAGTKVGHTVRCQALSNDGRVEEFPARVVEAAYSSRTRTDWSLLEADSRYMAGISPIKLSKEKPDTGKITGTWGCPRCEVPRGQVIQTVRLGSVWYWQPNSIGGQSGSAVVQDGKEYGLLTWTENGNGSGQFTATIWQQSNQQNTDGPARTGAEVPVTTTPAGVELREGYHKEQASLGEYPIWAGENDPPGGGGNEPPNPCPAISPEEQQLRDMIGSGNWDAFIKQLLVFVQSIKE